MTNVNSVKVVAANWMIFISVGYIPAYSASAVVVCGTGTKV